jgi:coenzyme F420-0:L-glutamate ligase / coenzyme F420-1:gamma-L-glutamate ligase
MGAEFRLDLQRDGLSPAQIDVQVERSGQRIQQAPVLIVLCLDPSDLDSYPDAARSQAEHTMAVQSVALAAGTLMLAAHACGLGTVWMCAPLFAPAAVSQALDLPPDWQPQGMLLAGYPAQVPPPRPRRSLSEVARYY